MATASSSSGASTQPNTSLYIKNLNTKTKKPELRRQLYALFSTYGKVIDVVATRADGMRGQAFVVFGDLRSATAARRALDGFEFYEKSIKIEYARSRSKATIVLEDGPEALFDPSLISSGADAGAPAGKVTFSSAQADQRGRERKRAREEARQRGEKVDGDDEEENEEEREEEAESDDGEEDAEAQRESKVRKVDGGDGAKEDGTAAKKAEESDEDDAAMDMADSDSDDDDTPGPPAPPPAS